MASDTPTQQPNFGDWTPQEARREFRAGHWPYVSCSVVSFPYIKAGVLVIPSCFADDFEEFCRLNEGSCPLLYRSRPGEVSVPPLAADSDIRTDLQLYSIFTNGVLRDTVGNVSHISWHDMVTFYMGCSFSFEHALLNAGVAVRHVEKGVEVPVYSSGIRAHPVGPFSGNTIVSMRPMPRDHIRRAVEVTAVMDCTGHGAPVHIGDPCMIGIRDLYTEYYGGVPPYPEDGDVPVFWACNITSGEVWKAAKCPELSIAHSGETVHALFICDLTVEEYNVANPPGFGSELRPRVIFVSEDPLFASLLSDKALDQLYQLESRLENRLNQLESHLESTPQQPDGHDSFVKGVLRLSRADIITLNIDVKSEYIQMKDSAQALSVLSLTRSAQALGKRVILRTRTGDDVIWSEFVKESVDVGLISQPIKVETGSDVLTLHENGENNEGGLETSVCVSLGNEGFIIKHLTLSASASAGRERSGNEYCSPVASGEGLAIALFILHSCPIHSRYYRKGRGEFKMPNMEDFVATDQQIESLKASLGEEVVQ